MRNQHSGNYDVEKEPTQRAQPAGREEKKKGGEKGKPKECNAAHQS